MLRLKEAAKKLDVSISWLNKMIDRKFIKVVWFGGVRRVSEDEIERIQREGIEL